MRINFHCFSLRIILSSALLMDCGAECRFNKRKWTSQDTKEDILFHVSNVFNPVHLFHLFLAEVKFFYTLQCCFY